MIEAEQSAFFIADTFNDSLARLTAGEQKAVKTTAFDLQLNPANPGMKFHRVERAQDPDFWSVRVSRDIRIIVHRQGENMVLCYVGHHDHAYRWAQRRKLEIHPMTGAAQLVEVRETVREIEVRRYVDAGPGEPETAKAREKIFSDIPQDKLFGYGVPEEWVNEVREADEDSILEIAEHLPSEAAEALLNLAVGKQPEPSTPPAPAGPFEHPDAQRRFRLVTDIDELRQALDYPWEKWTIFLHPAQRKIVEKTYNGPARVSGSAGTGKTIVALHRAVFLAKHTPSARILLTTFSAPLARALNQKLKILLHSTPRLKEQIEVMALDELGLRLYRLHFGKAQLAGRDELFEIAQEAAESASALSFSLEFVIDEWKRVVDAWQVDSWEQYRGIRRLGRRKRLSEGQRKELWQIFSRINKELSERGLVTWNTIYGKLAGMVKEKGVRPFDFAVVDEAQDISVSQLMFLSTLGASRKDSLFFAGDIGQRIFQQPFSWKTLGVDIRGRSHILRINYRTSHQIRIYADRLLPPEVSDVDGNREDRTGTVSVFNGPEPQIVMAEDEEAEKAAVARWLGGIAAKGTAPEETGIFVRSEMEIPRALKAVEAAGFLSNVLDEQIKIEKGHVSVGTMHLAKGLEFKAVAVMACDEEIIPLESRIEAVADENELEEVYASERHLLYVACTRARDSLIISGVEPGSEFIEDML